MAYDINKLLVMYPGIPKDYQDMMIRFDGSWSWCGCLTLEYPSNSDELFPKLENASDYIWILTDLGGKWIGYEKARWRIVGIEELEQRIHYLAFDLADLDKKYRSNPELF